jgi:hypothetical protein
VWVTFAASSLVSAPRWVLARTRVSGYISNKLRLQVVFAGKGIEASLQTVHLFLGRGLVVLLRD